MSKIEERHDKEFIKAVTTGNLKDLENEYHDILNNATLNDLETLEKLHLNIIEEAQNVNLKASEALENKIEANHQRRLRYNHVGSINYKVGITKTNEFGDFLTSTDLTPEKALIYKEKQNELKSALKFLDPVDQIIFNTYQELQFYPTKQNWKELSESLLNHGIKMSDKTVKNHFEKSFKLLQSLVQ